MKRALTNAICGFVLLLISGACPHPISTQLRTEAQNQSLTFAMVLEDPAAFKGGIVLWGGKIIETTNLKHGTELLVLETPLNFLGTPDKVESSQGRFIAKSPKFLDPAIYTDRIITLAGEVIGKEERKLGKTTYKYPVLVIKELHLWERYYKYPADYYWYDPFWGSYHYGPGQIYYH